MALGASNRAVGRGTRAVVPCFPLQEHVGRRQAGIKESNWDTASAGWDADGGPGPGGSAASRAFNYFKVELGEKAGQREELSHRDNMGRAQGLYPSPFLTDPPHGMN